MKPMREWIIGKGVANEEELNAVEENAVLVAREGKQKAWEKYISPIKEEVGKTIALVNNATAGNPAIQSITNELQNNREPMRRDIMKAVATILDIMGQGAQTSELTDHYNKLKTDNSKRYNTFLYNDGPRSALKVP